MKVPLLAKLMKAPLLVLAKVPLLAKVRQLPLDKSPQ